MSGGRRGSSVSAPSEGDAAAVGWIGSEAFGGWYEPASGRGTGSAGNDGCGDGSSVDGDGDTEGADGGDVVGGCCSWVGSGDCCATGAPLTPPAVNATAMAVAKATPDTATPRKCRGPVTAAGDPVVTAEATPPVAAR